jgi:predicted membrane-bound dolichyl-phosphate-mannose-protein mannosyltransferase
VDPNQWTFPGIITGVAILIVGGFIAYKIIRAIATFVDALQGGPHPLIEDEDKEQDED